MKGADTAQTVGSLEVGCTAVEGEDDDCAGGTKISYHENQEHVGGMLVVAQMKHD